MDSDQRKEADVSTAPPNNPAPDDENRTVVLPLEQAPTDTSRTTVDLRGPTEPSRLFPQQPDAAAAQRVTVPAELPVPAQRPADQPEQQLAQAVARPAEKLRFGPGVPAVVAVAPVPETVRSAEVSPGVRKRRRRQRILNGVLTAALAAVVIWLLWPAGSLRVRQVTVSAVPTTVTCGRSADVVATVLTNGHAGQLHYRWERNDGLRSSELQQSVSRRQHSIDLHLRWDFRGPGTYAAQATVLLLKPTTQSATVHFTYHC
jgi:hypothetical protein